MIIQKQRIFVNPAEPGTRPELQEPPTITSEELFEERDILLYFDENNHFSILTEQDCVTQNFTLEFVIEGDVGCVVLPMDKKFNTDSDTERELCVPLSVVQKVTNNGNGNHWIVSTVEQYLNVTHKPSVEIRINEIYTDINHAIPEALIIVRVGKFKTSATTDLAVLYPFLDEMSQHIVSEIHPEIAEYSTAHR